MRSRRHARAGGARAGGERGAAAVELALVVPLFLLILIGIINVGVMVAQQIALGNAARQAARYAVVDGPTCTDVEAQARDALSAPNMDSSAPTFSLSGGPCPKPCQGSAGRTDPNVTVTLRYTSTWVVPFPVPGLGTGRTLEGKGRFRCEFS
ncbi:TadE/TadG family type IV pilus assembly protein [Nocardioides zeicaulis]|uniref:TadE/TadG family type IV pilus assembly protein n=1 Tax=Nocardioides zeicaulis TaxID=1776857 RepID=A0ABV6DX81_9ACTN